MNPFVHEFVQGIMRGIHRLHHVESVAGNVIGCTGVVLLLYFWIRGLTRGKSSNRSGGKSVGHDPLDVPIYRWNERDLFTWRDLLSGGVHAYGRTSAGKTTGMKGLARAIIRRNSSMLILCGKKNEYKDWLAMAADAGRSEDVVLIDAKKHWRLNMIGYEAIRKGDGAGQTANIVRFIMELRSVIFREAGNRDGEGQYWEKQTERGITHAVNLLMLAGMEVTPDALHKIFMSAPESMNEVESENWKKSPCYKALEEAENRTKNEMQWHDFQLADDYFTVEVPMMADRTRASIVTGIMGTLTTLNTGLCKEMFASTTNTTPYEQIEGKRIVILNYPPDEWGDIGLVANIGMKHLWQKEILRREITAESPVAVIWGDEASLWVTESDAKFLSRCRSYYGCMVYLCQSLSSYKEALPGQKAEAVIEAMQGNFGTKVVFALGCHATARWAADLVGKELQTFGGGSIQHEGTFQLFRHENTTSSFNQNWADIIQPGAFMNNLRTGAEVNGYQVDAVLVRSGAPFSNGLPYLTVTFNQERN